MNEYETMPDLQVQQMGHYTDYYYEPFVATDGDVQRTIRLLMICGAAGIVTAMLYLATRNLYVSVIPLATAVFLCSLFHIPIAFFFLFSSLPLEMLLRLSESFTLGKLMGITIILGYILLHLGSRFSVPTVVKCFIAFGIFCLLSVLWALAPLYSAVNVLSLIMYIGLMLVLVNMVQSIKMFQLIGWGMLATSALAAVFLYMGVGAATEWGGRITFEGENPNVVAAILAISLIIGVYLFFNTGLPGKLLCFGMCAITSVGILYTQSRSALASVVAAMLLSLIFLMKGHNKIVYLMMFVVFCIVGYVGYRHIISSEFLGKQATERLENSTYSLQHSGRTHFWKQGLKYISERPVTGYGYKNYAIRYGGGIVVGRDAHNSIISITSETGIMGLFLYLLFQFLLFKDSLKLRQSSLQWLCTSLLLFSFFNGITHTTYGQKDFWFAMGFVALITMIDKNESYYPMLEYS